MKDYAKALKSWFQHKEIKIEQKFKLPKAKTATKTAIEQSPTPDLFRRVLNAVDLKQKVESTLTGLAGLRPDAIGSYDGNDGLQVRDFPEMSIDHKAKVVEFTTIPTIVVVRANLSKADHQYFTFMPNEGCQYVRELLEYRMREKAEKALQGQPYSYFNQF